MNTLTDYLGAAAQARRARRYADARSIYLEALSHWQDDPDIMWAIAEVELALSIVTPDATDSMAVSAITRLRQAILLRPDKPEYHFALGNILHHTFVAGHEGAANAYRAAIMLQPHFLPALDHLAGLHGTPGHAVQLDEAIAACELLVSCEPTRSRWLRLAGPYAEDGRAELSARAANNALIVTHETSTVVY
jgi:hypothetical protein